MARTGRSPSCATHEPPLAHISHRPSTTHAYLLAVKGRTPCSRLDVVSATPSPSSGPCPPTQRHLDALATNGGEICGLAAPKNPPGCSAQAAPPEGKTLFNNIQPLGHRALE